MAYDLMKAFASANIPVEKIEHKAIKDLFTKYFSPHISIPGNTLIRKQLPVIEQELFLKIKNQLHQKKIAVLADESADDKLRYFFHILFLELNIFNECQPYLADTIFLVNHKTVAQAILKCLNR